MIRIIMAITVLGKQIKIGKKKKKAQMVNAIENDFFCGVGEGAGGSQEN